MNVEPSEINNVKILLIDDNNDEYYILKKHLGATQQSEMSYSVSLEQDYSNARNELLNNNYDLFILDYKLGKQSGLDLLMEVKEHCMRPIIMYTSKGNYKVDKLALENGAWAYIEKCESSSSVIERTVRYIARQGKEVSCLKKLAQFDCVTGLYNRRALFEILSEQISFVKRYELSLCFCLADLDNFKEINDTYGHTAGDLVLEFFATNMQKLLRKEDVIGRYGGDEFAIIFTSIDIDSALISVNRIKDFFDKNAFDFEGQKIRITASFGLSEYNSSEEELYLFEKADKALYHSKQNGRNIISIY